MSDFRRSVLSCLIFCAALFCALMQVPYSHGQIFGSQKLTVTVTPQGSAAKEKPLPVGAFANLKVIVRNETKDTVGPVTLSAKFEGMKAEAQKDWKIDGENISGEIPALEPGGRVERSLRLRIAKAAFPAAKSTVTVDANAEKISGSGTAAVLTADCVGAFREKLGVLRPGPAPSVLQNVRDAADAMRKPDVYLPSSRMFPLTNSRKPDISAAERLSLPLSARQAADMQMSTEWYRFLIQRWASEVQTYATQPVHPGLCANNYYQIAGYREGLQPVTKRLDSFRDSGKQALEAARAVAKDNGTPNARELVLKIAKSVEAEGIEDTSSVFAMLTAIRVAIAKGKKLEPEQLEILSLAETSAWLEETNKRGQALNAAIEKVLATIGEAHKESCVCAF